MSRGAQIAAQFSENDPTLAKGIVDLADSVDRVSQGLRPVPATQVLQILADSEPVTIEELTAALEQSVDASGVHQALEFLQEAQFVSSGADGGRIELTAVGELAAERQREHL